MAYAVTVLDTPVITSSNATTFTVGTAGLFGISNNISTVSVSTLPNGLSYFTGGTLDCLLCAESISGTPAVGSGGQYSIAVTDTASTGPESQNIALTVNEAPSITTPNLVVLFAGQPASVEVSATGYPSLSSHTIAANSTAPSSPSQGSGMYFTTIGLPASLHASNLNSRGLATGTLTISGTPSTADVGGRKVAITATNAVGSPAQQNLTVEVYPYSPTTAVNLISSEVLSRDASNNVVATMVVANAGNSAAQNVTLTSVKIGSVTGTGTPLSIGSIAAAGTAVFTVTFPASSLGVSGSPSTIAINGSCTGGTFNTAGRIALP